MSWFSLFKAQIKFIFTTPAIVLTVFGGGIFYSFLYPQPYIHQMIQEQKIMLIDLDNSTFSQKFASLVNASSYIDISHRGHSLKEAEQSLSHGEIVGYLLIPKDFYKDILLHKSPVVAFGADASYFLIYGTISQTIFEVIQTLGHTIHIKYQATANKAFFTPQTSNSSLTFTSKPLFNPNMGYVNYVIPAVFILILHQVMILGAAILGARENEEKDGYWSKVSPLKLLASKLLLFFIIYLPLNLYYLGFCFELYGVPHVASYKEIFFLICLLIFSATSLGILLGCFMPRQELVTFVVLVSSLPLLFSAGFIWPTLAIEQWINFLIQWAPITPLIMAFLKLNQLNADFYFIANEMIQIASLGGLFFLLSWLALRRKQKISK